MRRGSIAFQGERGAFSEEAAFRFFGPGARTVPVKTFEGVFRSVRDGDSRYGIVPIENSLFGSIHENYDLLRRFDVFIAGEIKLRVVHALLVNRGVGLGQIRFVYSHPQALGQCERFLSTLRDAEIVAVYDTAGAAKFIREAHRIDAAAIAGVRAARVYGLRVLRKGIESHHRNFTRFLILATAPLRTVRHAKTSVLFAVKNIPGALSRVLSVFSLRDINLYKIESRPLVGKPWEYLFYLDFAGSPSEEVCRNALSHLRELTTYQKILGAYPEGKTVGD